MLVLAIVSTVLRDEPPRAAEATEIVVALNSLVEIDPATNRRLLDPGREDPESIAATADAIWVANGADRTVAARVDRATRDVRILGVGAAVAHQLASSLSGDVAFELKSPW